MTPNKPTTLTEQDFEIERKKILQKELKTTMKYLKIPLIGLTLYKIAKLLKYE